MLTIEQMKGGIYVLTFEDDVVKMTKLFQDVKHVDNPEVLKNLEKEPNGFYLEIK